jgi:hypothetical protein
MATGCRETLRKKFKRKICSAYLLVTWYHLLKRSQ